MLITKNKISCSKIIAKLFVHFFFFTCIAFSQSKTDDYFVSLTVLGGIYNPNGQIADEFKPGLSGGVEVQYGNINRGLYVNVQYNSFGYRGTYIRNSSRITNYTLVNQSNSTLTEISGGLRFYFGKPRFKGLVEGGGGTYFRQRNAFTESYTEDAVQITRSYNKSTQDKFWINIGAGLEFSASKKLGILLKSKLHISGEAGKIITFNGFYAGIKINL